MVFRSAKTTAQVIGATVVMALVMLLPDVDDAEAKGKTKSCQTQKPQSFLIRKAWLPKSHGAGGQTTAKEAQRRQSAHRKAIKYRVTEYGYVDGTSAKDGNSQPATDFAENTTFFSLPVKMHKKVVPALHCVEREIKKSCSKEPYTPKGLSSYRDHNTYRGGEITNHLFGIALDIDSERNPCCGCVDPWPDNPRCQGKAKSIYDRMDMPKCWVDTFEKYGFYWLGHDDLQDTMHFEFLGDPDKIVK